MKKPKSVIDAEAFAAIKKVEFDSAKAAMDRSEKELIEAVAAVRTALIDADATLPKCRKVRVRRQSGTVVDLGQVVIVRKTPGGRLVVRNVGEPSGTASQYKWNPHSGVFRQIEKSSWNGYINELRDVPAQHLPAPSQLNVR